MLLIKNFYDPVTRTGSVLLQPNWSLTWRQCTQIFALIALVTVVIALFFLSMGAWLVLPFAGFELAFLATCLYLSACKQMSQDVLQFSEDTLTLQRGRRSRRGGCYDELELPRTWIRVESNETPAEGFRIVIMYRLERVWLGDYLNEDERKVLYQLLREIINSAR